MSPEEINEAVARKLGWVEDHGMWDKGPGTSFRPSPRDYCHSIEAAFEIVNYCLKPIGNVAQYDFELNHIDEKEGWIASFVEQGELHGTYGAQARADTAPMAIALAFLKLPSAGRE